MTRIAILDDYTDVAQSSAHWAQLGDAQIDVVNPSLMASEAERIAALAPYEVLVAMRERTAFPATTLQALPLLKLLVTTGMRNASIDMVAARAQGVDVCGTQMTPYAAFEHSWALLLSLAKNIPAEHAAMVAGGWQEFSGVGLNGKTLGLVGLGKLGAKAARVAQAFDMNVIAWSPNLTEARAAEHGAKGVDKETLFRQADFVMLHMVLSAATRGLVGVQEFGQMKPTAHLINTSRGPLVDEAALIDALRNGQIAGAGLDVYDVEPLPADHALRGLGNVVLTGHTGYVIREMFELAYGQALENILAWQGGSALRLLNGTAHP
jgi:phosphoglycerate dehydrogenase-like enzyme